MPGAYVLIVSVGHSLASAPSSAALPGAGAARRRRAARMGRPRLRRPPHLSPITGHVSERFRPYCMDVETFEAHVGWSRLLTGSYARNPRRLLRHPVIPDMRPVIEHMLARGLKLV